MVAQPTDGLSQNAGTGCHHAAPWGHPEPNLALLHRSSNKGTATHGTVVVELECQVRCKEGRLVFGQREQGHPMGFNQMLDSG